jgi:ABC-type glycerol-3-phosphate transport system permease component
VSSLRAERRRRAGLRAVLLGLAMLAFVLPLGWTLLAALGLEADNGRTPPTFVGPLSLDHFLEVGVAEPSFGEELVTSGVGAACATLLATAVSFLFAYGLARSRFRGRLALVQGFLVLACLPAMAYVIPLSDLMRRALLSDSLTGLVLTEAAVTTPLAVYVLHGALAQLPAECEEAAWLDGGGLFRILGRVVLPLIAPSVGATAIVLFVLNWNLLLVPLVLTSGDLKTVPVAMSDFFTFERELDWPTAAAALVISLAPVAVLVGVFHRILTLFTLRAGDGD